MWSVGLCVIITILFVTSFLSCRLRNILSPLLSAALSRILYFHSIGLFPNASAPLLQDKELSGKEQPDNRRLLSMRDVSRNMHLLVINWKVHENSTTPWPWRDLVVVNEMTWGAPIPAFGNKHSRFESSYSPTLRASPDGH